MTGRRFFLISVSASAAIVVAGLLVMLVLANLRKPPAEAEVRERSMQVEGLLAKPGSFPVSVTAFGVARARDVVPITPEVSGMVVEIHPRLELGEVIAAGDLLFVIDPRDYEAQVQAARAEVSRVESAIQRTRTEWRNDEERRKTLERSRDLAYGEFQRLETLFNQDEVGTRSGVEAAERQYNQARDASDQLARSLNVYPIVIRETESALAAAKARLAQAETALARTRVIAPFNARVTSVSVELGQFIAPGAPVLTLSDDSLLEIAVSIDSRDARQWLKFADEQTIADTAWFSPLEPVACKVRWTEDTSNHAWRGTLDRVLAFDPASRKVTLAIRVDASKARPAAAGALPLVDGMFCSVEIPGRVMQDVYRLPQWAVSFDGDVNAGRVYVSEGGRLKSKQVIVVRREGDHVFVREGIDAGDTIVTTRLVNPLENSLLDVLIQDAAFAEAQ